MADNFISITTGTKRLANRLRETVDGIERQRDSLENLKQAMDQMIDGTNYATLETEFGLPTGKGQSVYNLVSGAITEINADTNLTQLLSWLAAGY